MQYDSDKVHLKPEPLIDVNFIFYFKVEQRDVPGIDCAHLAMDTEEGVEVVWNEVQFSERKNFKAQEEKIRTVFDNLTDLEHPNIVKFHRYWTDTHNDKPRVSLMLQSTCLKHLTHAVLFTGNFYNRIHVVGFTETVSEANETEC